MRVKCFLFTYCSHINIFVIRNYGNLKLISVGHSVTFQMFLCTKLERIKVAELNFSESTTTVLVVSALRMAAKIETGVFLHQLTS